MALESRGERDGQSWVFEDRDTPVGYKVLERATGRIVGWIYRREDALRVAAPVTPKAGKAGAPPNAKDDPRGALA